MSLSNANEATQQIELNVDTEKLPTLNENAVHNDDGSSSPTKYSKDISKQQSILSLKEEESKTKDTEKANIINLSPEQQLIYYSKLGDNNSIKNLIKLYPTLNINYHETYTNDVNSPDYNANNAGKYSSSNTALHYAVQYNCYDTVELLYNLSANIESPNKLGSTPLHIAASYGHVDVIKFLLKSKADIKSLNKIQNKPLHCAIYNGSIEAVNILLNEEDNPIEALLSPNGVGMSGYDYIIASGNDYPKLRSFLDEFIEKNKEKIIQLNNNFLSNNALSHINKDNKEILNSMKRTSLSQRNLEDITKRYT